MATNQTTDFTDGIIASNGFIISKVNVPTRVGCRIVLLSEMEKIPNPFIGQIVYVSSIDEYYSVKTLKSKVVGGVEVKDSVVDTYDRLFKSEIEWVDVD